MAQRMASLEKANAVRKARAILKAELKSGKRKIADLILEPPDEALGMKVFDLFMAYPQYGKIKTHKLLAFCRISTVKTLGGLTMRQRADLIASMRYLSRKGR